MAREKRDVVFGTHDFAEGQIAWVQTFCFSCNKLGPRVPEISLQSGGYEAYVCNDCAVKYRDQLLLAVVPDEIFWRDYNSQQVETYGRTLEAHELVELSKDPNSVISKMLRSSPLQERINASDR